MCPKCGKFTYNWRYLQSRIRIKCESCGYEDNVSNTPISGAQVSSDSRTPAMKAA